MAHRQWGQAAGIGVREALFLVSVAAATWAGSESGAGGEPSSWFRQTSFGAPLHYLLFAGFVIAISPYVVDTPRFPLTLRLRQIGVWPFLVVGWAVLALAIGIALIRNVPELFVDWRNLVVVAATAVVSCKWLAAHSWRKHVLVDLAIVYGLLAIPEIVAYAAGYGASVFGVRTTTFEASTLYLSSFAAITSAWNLLTGEDGLGRTRTTLLRIAGIAGSLLVILSFRRSFWVAWGIGMVCVLVLYLRRREANQVRLYLAAVIATGLVITAFVSMGTDTIIARLQSFVPTNAGLYTATNVDHVNDLIDAWAQIEPEPILGLGIGRHYETNLIADWKEESFDVHNALLHVWLKFGLVGALAYLGFHIVLARFAARQSNLVPIGAFLVGELVATTVGTWPYGAFKMSVFHGLLLAVVAVGVEPAKAMTSVGGPLAAEIRLAGGFD